MLIKIFLYFVILCKEKLSVICPFFFLAKTFKLQFFLRRGKIKKIKDMLPYSAIWIPYYGTYPSYLYALASHVTMSSSCHYFV